MSGKFACEVLGASALYTVDRDRLRPSPVVRQCIRVTDRALLKPMFRKLADDAPAYALTLKDRVASVAACTHLRDGVARMHVYTVEEARRRGFGRGVITALAEELIALNVQPTLRVELSDEPSVRMAENAGLTQVDAFVSARLTRPAGPGLVQLERR
jgi:GNAT superfamily N-acetyltransferase